MELNYLLKKLIHNSAGRTRWWMATIGLSVALLLLLVSVQIQENYHYLLTNKTNQDSIANFLVINKQLNQSNILHKNIDENIIQDLGKQPFVDKVGKLMPSSFKASLQSNSDRFPFYTDISFESVPTEFIDIQSKEWAWDSTDNFIPIIAPNMFLDFYNLEFSVSQNLPALTQEVAKMIVFKVIIKDELNQPHEYKGRIVGFSDRITSLLVPQEFMEYAHRNFCKQATSQATRIIIRTKDPGNPALTSYLQQHGLTTDADKTRFSKYRKLVTIIVDAGWIIGGMMLIFALLIFTLFIQLTIASSKQEIALLITLGVSPKQLRHFLLRQFIPPNIISILISLAAISALQYVASHWLLQQNIYLLATISWLTIFTAIAILLLILIVYQRTIYKYIYNT